MTTSCSTCPAGDGSRDAVERRLEHPDGQATVEYISVVAIIAAVLVVIFAVFLLPVAWAVGALAQRIVVNLTG